MVTKRTAYINIHYVVDSLSVPLTPQLLIMCSPTPVSPVSPNTIYPLVHYLLIKIIHTNQQLYIAFCDSYFLAKWPPVEAKETGPSARAPQILCHTRTSELYINETLSRISPAAQVGGLLRSQMLKVSHAITTAPARLAMIDQRHAAKFKARVPLP